MKMEKEYEDNDEPNNFYWLEFWMLFTAIDGWQLSTIYIKSI